MFMKQHKKRNTFSHRKGLSRISSKRATISLPSLQHESVNILVSHSVSIISGHVFPVSTKRYGSNAWQHWSDVPGHVATNTPNLSSHHWSVKVWETRFGAGEDRVPRINEARHTTASTTHVEFILEMNRCNALLELLEDVYAKFIFNQW